jgi:hypothetical protein
MCVYTFLIILLCCILYEWKACFHPCFWFDNFHTLCIDCAQPDPTIFEILRYELSWVLWTLDHTDKIRVYTNERLKTFKGAWANWQSRTIGTLQTACRSCSLFLLSFTCYYEILSNHYCDHVLPWPKLCHLFPYNCHLFFCWSEF